MLYEAVRRNNCLFLSLSLLPFEWKRMVERVCCDGYENSPVFKFLGPVSHPIRI